MYKAEVLGKLPVVQHFYFGKLLPFPSDPNLEAEEAGVEDEHGHIHGKSETGWTMDCCGIPGEFACEPVCLEPHPKDVPRFQCHLCSLQRPQPNVTQAPRQRDCYNRAAA